LKNVIQYRKVEKKRLTLSIELPGQVQTLGKVPDAFLDETIQSGSETNERLMKDRKSSQ
jgi:hypothetical protein